MICLRFPFPSWLDDMPFPISVNTKVRHIYAVYNNNKKLLNIWRKGWQLNLTFTCIGADEFRAITIHLQSFGHRTGIIRVHLKINVRNQLSCKHAELLHQHGWWIRLDVDPWKNFASLRYRKKAYTPCVYLFEPF